MATKIERDLALQTFLVERKEKAKCHESPTKVHRWILGQQNGTPIIEGICRYCLEIKSFSSSEGETTRRWNNKDKI